MNRAPFYFIIVLLALCVPGRSQEFLQKRLVTPSLHAEVSAVTPGKPFTVGALLKLEPGWHTYWQYGGDSGAPTKIDWELPAGFTAGPIQWPVPTARADEGDQLTFVYEDEVMLLVEITPPAQLPGSGGSGGSGGETGSGGRTGEIPIKATLRWLTCKETCIPGEGEVSLSLPQGESQAANTELFAKWRARLPKSSGTPFKVSWETGANPLKLRIEGLPKEFKLEFFPLPPLTDKGQKVGHPTVSEIASDGSRTITVPYDGPAFPGMWQGVIATQKENGPREAWSISSPPVASGIAAPEPAGTRPPMTGAPARGLLSILWGAFLGGLILNLMPCVLPVIALKIFGFVQQANQAPKRVFRLGLAFVAGVFTFFMALATLVAVFQAAGHGLNWGFQFQNPYILAGLISLVFVFALAMFGVFEITVSSHTATTLDSLSRKEGYSGAFVHGLFTTLLGTSCTAPLLGPVLGFAFIQPPAIVFLIFAVIAAGMSLPYFLLTWQPTWMRFLPKPGAWMERMKQFMGFVLLGVVLWLIGVFGRSRGIDGVIALSSFLLVLAIAAWIYGFARNTFATLLGLALGIGGWFVLLDGKLNTKASDTGTVKNVEGAIPWQVFTPERLRTLRQEGKPVFIDFTADWCLNCKYNERFVLETEPVRAAFRERQIIPLKADWTNADPAITALLKSFGRVGVPAYVYFPANEDPVVLPEILTQALLLEALAPLHL